METLDGLRDDSTPNTLMNHFTQYPATAAETLSARVAKLETQTPGQKPLTATKALWKADPTKLPHPVRNERTMDFALVDNKVSSILGRKMKSRVNGFPSPVHSSVKDARAIEHFMNHGPEDCIYSACGCRGTNAAARARATTALTAQEPAMAKVFPAAEPQVTSRQLIYNCNNPMRHPEETVDSADAAGCTVGTYYKLCVGLASRRSTTGWRCCLWTNDFYNTRV